MTTKIYKKNIPIYFGEFWVIITDNFYKSGLEIGMDLPTSIDDCLGLATTKTLLHAGVFIVFIKTNKIDHYDVIAHEALHTVNAVFKSRGIEIDTSNDEAQAYFLGWVVSRIHEAINTHKKTIKNDTPQNT